MTPREGEAPTRPSGALASGRTAPRDGAVNALTGNVPGLAPGPNAGPGGAQGMPAREPDAEPPSGYGASAEALAPPEETSGKSPGLLRLALTGLSVVALLYVAFGLYAAGEPLFAVAMLALAIGIAIIYGTTRFYAARFVFPATVAVLAFIALPVAYTSYLGFTNYGSANLLTKERATRVLLSRVSVGEGSKRPFTLIAEGTAGDGDGAGEGDGATGASYRLLFPSNGEAPALLSEPFSFAGTGPIEVAAQSFVGKTSEPLGMRDVVKLRNDLARVSVTTPDGSGLRASGLREFAAVEPLYREREDGALLNTEDGSVLTPDTSQGFYVTEEGRRIAPGWSVGVGLANFERVLTNPGIRAPMLSIFVWTVSFAALSTVLVFAVGVALASILQWPHLRGKAIYRVLLILPYAVPAFISILVFRGLFNQNFGEINLILDALFGFSPDWFTSGFWARTMLVIVNVWLGYPYMMLLAMGFLQSVPEDQKKAAALEGAGMFRTFFTITLPQILPPFLPMLIATFAFNFNNLVLVLLLTKGLPDIPGTTIPAGQTDILGSFTYRISFMDSGQNFGLAGAIATLIFVVVGLIAYANFIALRRAAGGTR